MILDTFISTCTTSKFGLGRLLCGRVRFRFNLDFSLDSFIIFFRVAGETEVLYETLNLFKNKVIGKKALVIGSETPWVEAILLAVGAKHVTTLEYNRITSTHPQVNNLPVRNLIITKKNGDQSFH